MTEEYIRSAYPKPKWLIFKNMIKLTDEAAARAKELIENSDHHVALRPAVRGGGCSGLSYTLKFSDAAEDGDRIIESKGVEIHVDKKSYLYLIGTEIDYEETIMSSGFTFNSPKATRSCGCGESVGF